MNEATPTPTAHRQIRSALRRMREEANYDPAGPSAITDRAKYAHRWWAEEDDCRYWIGCPDFSDREALIFAVEAAREICGGDTETAARLLRMAADDLESRS